MSCALHPTLHCMASNLLIFPNAVFNPTDYWLLASLYDSLPMLPASHHKVEVGLRPVPLDVGHLALVLELSTRLFPGIHDAKAVNPKLSSVTRVGVVDAVLNLVASRS